VIIVAIGLYVDAFSPKLKDKTYIPSQLPLGPWHMVNVYQYWVLLELTSFFTNFITIMVALFFSSLSHLKIERIYIVPAASLNNAAQQQNQQN
jgi:hypothetical protein